MDAWPHMTRLERDIVLTFATVVGVASLIGGAIGWVGHQLFTHLHHESPSDHFRRG